MSVQRGNQAVGGKGQGENGKVGYEEGVFGNKL